jgi:hypothetical protein
VQSLQETSTTLRGILLSRKYFPRKNKHHPIISAIKKNHCACLEWYITNGYNIFNEKLLQFVIDEIICRERFYLIKATTIVKIINLMENGKKYRNHKLENYVKFIVGLNQNDLYLLTDSGNIHYINWYNLHDERLMMAYYFYRHARQSEIENSVLV